MKIIYSNLTDVKTFVNKQNYETLKLSNYLSQKHGNYTIFYGDKNSLDIFKSIPFNEIHELSDKRIKEIPRELWSIGKFFSIFNINEPFLHMDSDMLLFRNINSHLLNKNVVYLHNEYEADFVTDQFQKFFNLQPQKCINFINRSYNCGVLGGQNYSLIKDICNEIVEFIIDNKNQISDTLNSTRFCDKYTLRDQAIMPSVLIEQVWIFKFLKYSKEEFSPILEGHTLKEVNQDAYTKNISHLQGTKNNTIIKETILKMNNILNI